MSKQLLPKADQVMADLLRQLDQLEAEVTSLRRRRVELVNGLLRVRQENERLRKDLARSKHSASAYLGQATRLRFELQSRRKQ